ncbi:hypothetical protein OHJ21_14150 [Virgibacillus sp. LDC1]|uniref:hypothetical protein n=1 Tax=unclassified Paenibacillus TaxID=185978 RepID=UPI000C26F6B8|nr:hypothetical protein [Paenibacillus sp. GM2FR]MCV4232322.1 hypothetical protein [Virgibacillus sp. LDC1]PJN56308.1 hypothetical protein PAEVO_30310 [Paenibacillus sp. GM2FR]
MHHTDRVRSRVPDGILIRGLDSAVYLVEHSKKRPIGDMVTFHSYGFTAKGIVKLDESTLEGMETGSPLNISGDFIMNSPATLLVKSSGSEIYLWSDQRLHPIVSLEMYFRLHFNYSSVVTLPDELIALLPEGDLIHDSSLLTPFLVNGRVYSAPNGLIYYGERHKLRKIGGPAIFTFYRWRVEEIVHLTRDEFHNYRLGEPIL